MGKNNQLRDATPVRRNYKLYKVKKQWVTACATFLVAFGAMAATNNVMADPTATAKSQPTVSQAETAKNTGQGGNAAQPSKGSTALSTSQTSLASAATSAKSQETALSSNSSNAATSASRSAAANTSSSAKSNAESPVAVSAKDSTASSSASASSAASSSAVKSNENVEGRQETASQTASSAATSMPSTANTSAQSSANHASSVASQARSETQTTTISTDQLSAAVTDSNAAKEIGTQLSGPTDSTVEVSDASQWSTYGVAASDQLPLTKTVTRTIYLHGWGGGGHATAETSFKRTALVDPSTHKVVGWVNPDNSGSPLAADDGDSAWVYSSGSRRWRPFKNTNYLGIHQANGQNYVIQRVELHYGDGSTQTYFSNGYGNMTSDQYVAYISTGLITSIKGQTPTGKDQSVRIDMYYTRNYFNINIVSDGQTIGRGVAVEGGNYHDDNPGGYITVHPEPGINPDDYYGSLVDPDSLITGFTLHSDKNQVIGPNNKVDISGGIWTPNFSYDGDQSALYGHTFIIDATKYVQHDIKFVNAQTGAQVGTVVNLPKGRPGRPGDTVHQNLNMPAGYNLPYGTTSLPSSFTYGTKDYPDPVHFTQPIVWHLQRVELAGPNDQKVYDGQPVDMAALLNKNHYYLHFLDSTTGLAPIASQPLQASDLSFADSDGHILSEPPTAPGTYRIVLNTSGKYRILTAFSDEGQAGMTFNSDNNVPSAITYTITQAPVSVRFSAVGTKGYDATPYLNNNGNVPIFSTPATVKLYQNGSQITASNVTFQSGDFEFVNTTTGAVTPLTVRSDATISGPTNVGTYTIQLTEQGLQRIENANPGYDYTGVTPTTAGTGTLTITPAKLSLSLSGTNHRTYDGKATTAQDVVNRANGDIQVILTYPAADGQDTIAYAANKSANYANDYTWETADGSAPINAGTYRLRLNDNNDIKSLLRQAIQDSPALQHLQGNVDIDQPIIKGDTTYTIDKKPLTVTLSNHGSTTYTANPINTPRRDLVNNLSTAGLISGDHLNTTGLQDSDFGWYTRDSAGNYHQLTSNPTVAGTYYLKLNDNDANLANANPNYQITSSGWYQYDVTKAPVTMSLAGSQTNTYNGRAHRLHGYYLDLTGTGIPAHTQVQLQAGDLEFSSDGSTWSTEMPINAGTYQTRLTDNGLNRIKVLELAAYGNLDWNAVTLADVADAAGFANYQIVARPVKISVSGNGSQVYNGRPVSFDYNSLTHTSNINGEGFAPALPTFTSADFAWYSADGTQLTQLPTDAGTYTLRLTTQGLHDIQAVNPNYQIDIDGNAYTYQVQQDSATVSFANNAGQQVAWTGSNVFDPTNFPLVVTTDHNGTLTTPATLPASDFQFYDSTGNLIAEPTEVGNYQVCLNAAGLAAVEQNYSNRSDFQWSTSASRASFKITKATATAHLNGSIEVSYTGSPATIPTNSDGSVHGVTVTLSNGQTYALKPGDLEFVDDSSHHIDTPTNHGTYLLRLSDTGLANIASAADGAHYVYSRDNTVNFVINRVAATIAISGQDSSTYNGSAASITDEHQYRMLLPGQTTPTTIDPTNLTFVASDGNPTSAPINAGSYHVGLTTSFRTWLIDTYDNYNLSFVLAPYTINAQNIALVLNGGASKVEDGRAATITSTDLAQNKLHLSWGRGHDTAPAGISYTMQPNDFEVVDNTGQPAVQPGRYLIILKQSVLNSLNGQNPNYTFTFANSDSHAPYTIYQASDLTVRGNQTTDVYGQPTPEALKPGNFTLTVSIGGHDTVIALQTGDLQIVIPAGVHTYPGTGLPIEAGQYNVTVTDQLLNRLAGDSRFAGTALAGHLIHVSDVADPAIYTVQHRAITYEIEGNQTDTYNGQTPTIDASQYHLHFTGLIGNDHSGVANRDTAHLGDVQLNSGDLEFVNPNPTNAGTYQIRLSAQGLRHLQSVVLPTTTNDWSQSYDWSQAVNTDTTGNFTSSNVTGNLTIAPLALKVTLTDKNGQLPSTQFDHLTFPVSGYTLTITDNDGHPVNGADGHALAYTLQDGQVIYKNGLPTAVGTYDVVLTPSAQGDLQTTLGSNNYTYTFSSNAKIQVTKGNAALNLIGGGESVQYTGQAVSPDVSKYQLDMHIAGGDRTNAVPAGLLTFFEKGTDAAGNTTYTQIANPTNVGTYYVGINPADLPRLEISDNYNWSTNYLPYLVTPATGDASLSGTVSKSYDGAPITDLSNITVTVTYPGQGTNTTYHLQSGDLQFVKDGHVYTSAPSDAGQYTVELTDQAKQRIARLGNVLNSAGQISVQNVNWPSTSFTGTGTYNINAISLNVTVPSYTQTVTYDGTAKRRDVRSLIPSLSAGTATHPVAVPTIPTSGPNALDAADFTIEDQNGTVVAYPTNAGAYYYYLNDSGLAKLSRLSANFVVPSANQVNGYGTLVIKPAAKTIAMGSASRTYQGNQTADGAGGNTVLAAIKQTITNAGYNATSLTVNDFDWWLDDTTDYGVSSSGPKDAGSYNIWLNNTGKQHLAADNPNYDLTLTDFKYTINKAKAVVGIDTTDPQSVAWNGQPIAIDINNFQPTLTVEDEDGHVIINPTDDSGNPLTIGNVALSPTDYEFVDNDGHVITSFAHWRNSQPAESTPFKVGTYHLRLTASGLAKLEQFTNNYDWSLDPNSIGTINIHSIAPELSLTGYGMMTYNGEPVPYSAIAARGEDGYPLMYVSVNSATSSGDQLLIEIPLNPGDYSWQLNGQPLTSAPINAGIYNLLLNNDHFKQSLAQIMARDTDYAGALDLDHVTFGNTSTLFYVVPATISAVTVNGHGSQSFNGAPATLTLTDLANSLSATGLVGTDQLDTSELDSSDYDWYRVDPTTGTETKLNTVPSAVGTYIVKLNNNGLNILQQNNGNYTIYNPNSTTPYAAEIVGGYNYQITAAQATATLSGTNDRTYNSQNVSTADINSGNRIAITISISQGGNSTGRTLTYHLQDGDYTWLDTVDHNAPKNAGTYTISLNKSAVLAHLRAAIANDPTWRGMVNLDESDLAGTATFTIDQKDATVSLTGSDNSAVYTGQPQVMPLAKLKTALSTAGLVNGEHLNTGGLTAEDFRGFQGYGEVTYITTAPVNAGQYSFVLKTFNNQGLAVLQHDNPNYRLTIGSNGFNYQVNPAAGQVTLNGGDTVTYTGQANSDLYRNFGVALSTLTPVSDTLAYTLTNGDLKFSSDGTHWTTTVPVAAGTYQVELSPAGWVHLAAANQGSTNINWPTGPAAGTSPLTYQINKAVATVTFTNNSQSVSYNGRTGQFADGGQFVPQITTNNGEAVTVPSGAHLSVADGDYEFNGHVLTTEPTELGTYTVTLSDHGLAKLESNTGNYRWENQATGTYTINRTRGVKITLVNVGGGQTATYKGSQFANTDLVNGNYAVTLANGETYTLQPGDLEFVAGQDPTNVGSYQVQLSPQGLRNIQRVDSSHYDYDLNDTGTATFTIAKATPSATFTGSSEKTYDGTAISGYTPTVTISAPGTNSVSLVAGTDYVWEKGGHTYTTAPTDAGNYTVTLTNSGRNKIKAVNADNLDWNAGTITGTGTYTIDPANAVITLSGSNQQTADWTGHDISLDLTKFVPIITDTSNSRSIALPTTVHLTAGDYTINQGGHTASAIEPGDYTVTLTTAGWQKIRDAISGNSNYQWQNTGAGSLHIKTVEAVIKLSGSTSTIYSGGNATVPVDAHGNVTGLTLTLPSGLTYQLKPEDLAFVEGRHTNVGTYHLQLSPTGISHIEALDSSHYDWSYEGSQATLTVDRATATYQLTGGQSKYYDGNRGSLTAAGHYQIKISLNNGQTVTYQLHDEDLAFPAGVNPTNKGIYDVILSPTGLRHLQEINPNYSWDIANSTSNAHYTVNAGVMSYGIAGEANTVFNGHDQALTQDQVNALVPQWAGYGVVPDGVTNIHLTPDDLEYVQKGSDNQWHVVTPHNAGTYGIRLKQSAVDRLNAANNSGNYTFDLATDVAASFIISRRQARLTLSGSQIDPYTNNGPLDVSNFTVKLTNTADGVPVTVTGLQPGDLLIQGYGQDDYPTDVGSYQVEVQQQLLNRLEREFPNYKFTADEVITIPTTGSGDPSVTSGSDTGVVDGNNDGRYIVTAIDGNIVLTINKTVRYGQDASIQPSDYQLQLVDAFGNAIPDITLTPADFQISGVSGTRPNVGTYQVTLTDDALNRIKASGINSLGNNNYNWLAPDYSRSTLTVIAEPVTANITNADTVPQSSLYSQPVNLDNSDYKITLTTQDGEALTYDLQPGDLAFVDGTPTNVGEYAVKLSPTGIEHLNAHFGSNYRFMQTHSATYQIKAATATVAIVSLAHNQKTYDSQPATINSGDYQLTVTTNNGQQINTSLNGNDLQFVDGIPTDAGVYAVELRESAIESLMREHPNYDWSQAGHVTGTYRIAPANVSVMMDPTYNLQSLIFDNHVHALNLTDFVPRINAGRVMPPAIPTTGPNALTTDDYNVTDASGNPVSEIKDAGTYNVSLNAAGLRKLALLSANFNWPTMMLGHGQVVVSPATVQAKLTRTFTKLFDGQSISLTDLNSHGGVNVTMTDGRTYALQSGDYQWNTADGSAPVNAGNYVLTLTNAGKQQLQEALDHTVGTGNVRLDLNSLGSTAITITPFRLNVTVAGSTAVPAGTTTIPNGVYSLHYDSGESGHALPTGLTQPTSKLNAADLQFIGSAPTTTSSNEDFTVGYKNADTLANTLGNNYLVSYVAPSANYHVNAAAPQTNTVEFVDDDESGHVVNTQSISGLTNRTISLHLTVPINYQLAEGQTVPTSYTFGTTNTPIVIHLKHQHQTLANDTKAITRTITAQLPDGTRRDLSQHVTLTRSATKDLVTNDVTYGPWSNESFATVAAPTVDGYTPSQATVPAVENVPSDYVDPRIEITYTPIASHELIRYVDEFGNLISSQTINGRQDSRVAFTANIPANWKAVGTVPTTITINDGTVNIVIAHQFQTVQDSHTATRTIIEELPTGRRTVTQTATITRQGNKDLVTNTTSWQPWTSDRWDAFTPTVPSGYTASPDSVATVTISPETGNQTVTITYQANGQQPTTPSTPTSPSGPTTPSSPTSPSTPTSPSGPTNPNQPTQPGQPTTPGHENNQQNDHRGSVDHQQAGGNGQAITNQLNDQSRTNGSRAGRLPQTGNDHNTSSSLLGLLLLSFLGLLGFGKRKKDQRDE